MDHVNLTEVLGFWPPQGPGLAPNGRVGTGQRSECKCFKDPALFGQKIQPLTGPCLSSACERRAPGQRVSVGWGTGGWPGRPDVPAVLGNRMKPRGVWGPRSRMGICVFQAVGGEAPAPGSGEQGEWPSGRVCWSGLGGTQGPQPKPCGQEVTPLQTRRA